MGHNLFRGTTTRLSILPLRVMPFIISHQCFFHLYPSNCTYVGPLHHTIADFWRMVWEQGTQAIVMVTNPIEGGIVRACKPYYSITLLKWIIIILLLSSFTKPAIQAKCEVYWPSCGNSQQYGIVMVTNMQEEIIPTCTIRKIMLSVAHKTKNASTSTNYISKS